MKALKILLPAALALSAAPALADDCQVPTQLVRNARALENQTGEVSALWKQLAGGSRASREADELFDAAIAFRVDVGRKSCDSLRDKFEEVLGDIEALQNAVAENEALRHLIDVIAAVADVKAFAIATLDLLNRLG